MVMLLIIGFVAGLIDTTAGGGGLITVPALLATGLSPAQVIATNKLQSSAGTASATYSFVRSGEVDWQGRDATGNLLPAGAYQFRVISAKGSEVLNVSAAGVYTRVTGAELQGGTPRLILAGGMSANLEEVTALRE